MWKTKTAYLIDGFNLYHSAVTASRDLGGASTKWLNVDSLCRSFLYEWGKRAVLSEIHYFSALAHHCEKHNPGIVARHQKFIDCLRSMDVKVHLANFKAKDVYCEICKKYTKHHEEKETDVALAVKLIELFAKKQCDSIVIVTGDTDIAPAVRTAKRLFPKKKVYALFPYNRKNKELIRICDKTVKLSKEDYHRHQFSNPHILKDGSKIFKPSTW